MKEILLLILCTLILSSCSMVTAETKQSVEEIKQLKILEKECIDNGGEMFSSMFSGYQCIKK